MHEWFIRGVVIHFAVIDIEIRRVDFDNIKHTADVIRMGVTCYNYIEFLYPCFAEDGENGVTNVIRTGVDEEGFTSGMNEG